MNRYVCVDCKGENCRRCLGGGWLNETLLHYQQMNSLGDLISKRIVGKRFATLGVEEVARKAAADSLTIEQLTEIEEWAATGPIKGQLMGLTADVFDALCEMTGIETPPKYVVDRPELKVIG